MQNNKSFIHNEREKLFSELKKEGLLGIQNTAKGGLASNADSNSKRSRDISLLVLKKLNAPIIKKKIPGQTAGSIFEQAIQKYIQNTFPKLQDIRPGKWTIKDLGNRNHIKLSDFSQYYHLKHLTDVAKKDPELAAALGNDYTIAPDIIIARELYTDAELNASLPTVDDSTSTLADIRKTSNKKPAVLHASISVKWTMRTDRAQNTRTEALNLIRNRKGHLPHIVAVTAECLPNRLSSLALGTGDIDCVYHIALYELQEAVHEYAQAEEAPELVETIETLVKGNRLKDISDLPLDLGV